MFRVWLVETEINEEVILADMAQVSNSMRTYELGHLLPDHTADWL